MNAYQPEALKERSNTVADKLLVDLNFLLIGNFLFLIAQSSNRLLQRYYGLPPPIYLHHAIQIVFIHFTMRVDFVIVVKRGFFLSAIVDIHLEI